MAAQDYRFIHWDIEQGLSIGQVNNIIKDQQGFIWMGTVYGLNRFDGHHFLNYFTEPGKNSIAGNSIYGLVEDSSHNIWIGTPEGLSRYDLKADSFTNFTNSASPSNTFIVPFWATANEVLCIESSSMVTAYDTKTLTRKVLVNHFENDENKDYLRFSFSILDPQKQSVWMLAPKGLMELSLTNGKQIYHPGNYMDAPSMKYDFRRKLIWVNATGGLMQFITTDKQFHPVPAMEDKQYEPYPGLDIDLQGRIWVGTVKKGILIYNPENHSVSQPFTDPEKQQLVSRENMCLYSDRLGITWTSNWALKGVYQLNPYQPSVIQYTTDSIHSHSFGSEFIDNLVADSDGNIWIGSNNGIELFNPRTNQFKLYSMPVIPGLKKQIFSPLAFDEPQQQILISSGAPCMLFELNVKTQQYKRIILTDSADHPIPPGNDDITAQAFQSGAVIYLDNYGFFQLKKDSTTARQIIPLHHVTITGSYLSPNGYLFIHLFGVPFNLTYKEKDGQWIRNPSPFDSLGYSCIYFDAKDHSYWTGEMKRLVHYNNRFQIIKVYEGLRPMSILADNSGNIWFNNSEGDISRLSVSSGKLITLSGNDGLKKQRFRWNNPRARDANGNLYFAGYNGIDRVSPEKLQAKYPPSDVYLQSVHINDQSLSRPGSIDKLSLTHFQNRIYIETGVIDFFSNNTNIRYKIEGISDSWQVIPANNPISLNGVQPGSYKLTVQASNAVNEYNGPEKILLVQIDPPWWKTWWAYGLVILICGTVIWTYIGYRSKNLKARNSELEEKVKHRTKELKHSLEELKETQTQLIQREKMASLGELTAGIAHEIQNPLNFVNNFSEINLELTTELNEELSKINIADKEKTLLEEIAGNIKENELKINHHGKRADSIVKGMLLHSRTSVGQKEATDINQLTDEYLKLAFHGMKAKEKSFHVDMKTDFDQHIGKIQIIPQDIGRVLLNVFNNAFYAVSEKIKRFVPDYEPKIWITTQKTGETVLLRIRDNGIGIPAKLREKIYQPFFTTKPAGQGTGLGLSLSFDIIKAHGGNILVDSKENEFTEFNIQLPVKVIN